MKKVLFRILFVHFLVFVFMGCAKRGTPEGGPIDEEPPEFIRASPENFSINFDGDEIEIFFDEYIQLEDAQRQIIFSPPMDPPPTITPLGTPRKSVKIEILDTLQPNTTYAINFGRSVVDNNEGNPLPFFRYIFSTGSYIDSLSLSGTVSNAYSKKTEPFISVMLYEVDSSYTDSIIYKKPPRYITNTLDSSVTFQLQNLKAGTYEMIALKDVNSNYTFEPSVDKIGFFEDFVQIPNDSTFHLVLFEEELPFEMAPRPEQVEQQHILFGYQGEIMEDSIQIELISNPPANFEQK
ncbi:MAG TPA: Ig-like domain-containing protein, partial [Salinimicrobium sp.]|nr:Ig-like domain-containing protein [Salinimicrobium sp.]